MLQISLFQALGQWSARRKTTRAKRANEKIRGTGGRSRCLSSRAPLTESLEQASCK